MKKALGLAVLMLFVGSTAAMAQTGLTGTGHDFSGAAWSGGDVCAPCHTPHAVLATDAPLWNHQLSISTFTPYTNPATMDAATGQPGGASAACLGCHDGLTAMDAFNGLETVADGLLGFMTQTPEAYGPNDNKTALVGIDLTNDHPVSINYAEAITNGELWLNPPGDAGVAALLRGGEVQCSSCHEPHNQGADTYAFLRVDNTNSAMCTTCHNKL